MEKAQSLLFFVLLFVSLIFSQAIGSSSWRSTSRDTESAKPTLWQVIENSTFASLLNATGLAPLLQSNASSLTVFAPTDDAVSQAVNTWLKNVTHDQLKQVLLYHLAAGQFFSNDLSNGQLLQSEMILATLSNNPQQLQISIATRVNATVAIKVDNARIVVANLAASNGVVHYVSSVIMPPALVLDIANSSSILSTFATVAAKLQSTVNANNVTVFAPTNDAFGAALAGYLLLPNSTALLEEVVSYHVVPNAVAYAGEIPQGATSLPTANNGEKLVVYRNGTTITINGVANVTVPNVLAANGVMHLISSVLLPNGFKFNVENALQGLNATVLLKQLERAGYNWLLVNHTVNTTYTIFAPTNEAFASSNAGINSYSESRLKAILDTQIVKANLVYLKKGQKFTNLNDDTLVVGDDGESISISGGNNVVAKIIGIVNIADNGIVYSIDKVIRRGGGEETVVSEEVVIVVLAVCVPLLLGLLGCVLLWDLRNWWKKKQALGYSPISGDEYEN